MTSVLLFLLTQARPYAWQRPHNISIIFLTNNRHARFVNSFAISCMRQSFLEVGKIVLQFEWVFEEKQRKNLFVVVTRSIVRIVILPFIRNRISIDC